MGAEKAEENIDTPDNLGLYLQDIGRYPLLDANRERVLAVRAQSGDNAALEQIISSNLRLVVSIAKKHFQNSVGIEPLDLVQELNQRLVSLAKRFDPSRNVRFSTYATWRLSGAAMSIILKRQAEQHGQEFISFPNPNGEDGDEDELLQLIADPTAENPEETAVIKDLMTQLRRHTEEQGLTHPEKFSLILRYAGSWQLNDIGTRLGMSYQTVQQTLLRALKKLQVPEVLEELK